VARALLVGCGCRGRVLGSELLEQGWAVRGTSRREEGLAVIESVGIESALADPLQPGTLLELVGDVTVVYWLLGSATGVAEDLEAIHGSRLQRLLEHLVETPVRRFVYEGDGTVDPVVLARGAALVAAASQRWRIPIDIVDGDAWRAPGNRIFAGRGQSDRRPELANL
jgi:uncharacterized protein YbjT (DUF2867 family)